MGLIRRKRITPEQALWRGFSGAPHYCVNDIFNILGLSQKTFDNYRFSLDMYYLDMLYILSMHSMSNYLTHQDGGSR